MATDALHDQLTRVFHGHFVCCKGLLGSNTAYCDLDFCRRESPGEMATFGLLHLQSGSICILYSVLCKTSALRNSSPVNSSSPDFVRSFPRKVSQKKAYEFCKP